MTPRDSNALSQYRRVDAAGGVEVADPHRLVHMLYDGLSEALSAARGALARGEPDVKGAAVGRAADILAVLKAGLNADRGGDVAGNLARLYEYMERRLTEGNLRNDADAFEELVTINDTLRGAWLAIPEDARRSSLAA